MTTKKVYKFASCLFRYSKVYVTDVYFRPKSCRKLGLLFERATHNRGIYYCISEYDSVLYHVIFLRIIQIQKMSVLAALLAALVADLVAALVAVITIPNSMAFGLVSTCRVLQ